MQKIIRKIIRNSPKELWREARQKIEKHIKNKICVSLAVLFTLLFLSVFPLTTKAETRIADEYMTKDTHWTKDKSPYILEGLFEVSSRAKLTIEEGVTVMLASSSSQWGQIAIDGDIDILGTKDEPVRFIEVGGLVLGENNKIRHGIFENTSIIASFGTTTISFSKFFGANRAIDAWNSVIDISDSEISNNKIGIISNLHIKSPQLMFNGNTNHNTDDLESTDRTGGIGNALEMDSGQNIITVRNTAFENNTSYSIKNSTANTIDAKENWWGNADGPSTSVYGAVTASPWLTKYPEFKEEENNTACCSSVLFLPGFQASRLYRNESGFFGTSTNQLWEPNRNDDVRKLFLDEEGNSVDSSIYTSDILQSAFGMKDIYKSFVAMMNSVVAEKTINEWLPFAYDWRINISDIVSGETKYAMTTKYLIEEVMRLARSSKTDKVSIVAHSNGGLVAKMLGQELEKQGKLNLIDKVIFVAVPHLGTPQALAGILHGNDQSILGGAVLSSGVARTLGLNMSGAYGLLPSSEYFNRFIDPVITLAGKALSSYLSFTDFLIGKSDNRIQPKESDLKTPAVLGNNLLTKAEWMHSVLDNWQFPLSTKIFSIIGWGMPTTETLEYDGNSKVTFKKNPEGDGTVVFGSANGYVDRSADASVYENMNDKSVFYLNQGLLNHDSNTSIFHSNILESDSVRRLISDELSTTSAVLYTKIDQIPPFMSYEKPNADDYPWMSWITASVHSPVDIDIYDSKGGHIGLIPLPTDPTSDIMWLEDTIGGQYDSIGDEKYITLPADDTYSVQFKGTGSGTFTFNVQKFVGGDMIEVASTTYADLPVTPLLLASTTINPLNISAPLNLDFDGNGKIDSQVAQSPVMDPLLHLDSMKTIILSLGLRQSIEKNILKKIERVRNLIKKGKSVKAIKRIQSMVKKVGNKHWNTKKLTENERNDIVYMFDLLLDNIEKD